MSPVSATCRQDLSRTSRSLANLQQVLEQFQDEKDALVGTNAA